MKIEKVGKLASNEHEKKENVMHIKSLKQALNHQLALIYHTKNFFSDNL